MPFASQRQVQLCYGQRLSRRAVGKPPTTWDCDEWLAQTPDAECLPTLAGREAKTPRTHRTCRKKPRPEGPHVSPYYRGVRGGIYFYADGVRVYVPVTAKAYVERTEQVLPGTSDAHENTQKEMRQTKKARRT